MMIRVRDNPTVLILHPMSSIQPAFLNADPEWDDLDVPVDVFSCDEFRMLEFKVKRCTRARSHDWTDCPYAHPGEKARRRDPLKYSYSGSSCPDYRKGGCRKGDACEYAHGVFESWLHPDRYRTQPCKDGTHCLRRVCFFAHAPEQLRAIPGGYSSPPESPPVSPSEALRMSGLAQAMRNLQVARQLGFTIPTRPGPAAFDPPMERVESGRGLRERMYAKLSLDNFVDSGNSVPDFGWIAELVN